MSSSQVVQTCKLEANTYIKWFKQWNWKSKMLTALVIHEGVFWPLSWVLGAYLITCSSSGWVLMTNIFSKFKNMNHQLSNALSTMFLRRLVIFIHFEAYGFENPQNPGSCYFPIYQLSFLPHIYKLYEAGSQVRPRIYQELPFLGDFRIYASYCSIHV